MRDRGAYVFVLSLLLVGLFSVSKPTDRSGSSICRASATAPLSAYQNVTTHEGDLIINGAQTYVVENCTYRVAGSVYVKDWSELVIRNALLIVDQNYSSQALWVLDSSKLVTENTTVDSQYYCPIDACDQAEIDFINSRITCGGFDCAQNSRVYIRESAVNALGSCDQSKVVVSDSEILWTLSICLSDSSQVAQLEGLRPGFYRYWNLHENQTVINVTYDLTVENSSVNSWSVEIDRDPKVTISDSNIERMGCAFHDTIVTIDGAKPGVYRNWTLGKLSLLNTSITNHWLLGFYNCSVEISNTTALIDLWKHNNISFSNSTLRWLKGQYGGVDNLIRFQRTSVQTIICHFSSFYICGEADFSSARVSEWAFSNITRNYDILAENANGNPAEETELTLLDKNGTLVWNGLTGSLGKANFDLTFTDRNYAETLVLRTFREGFYNVSETVDLLSKTPIVINLTQKPIGDINEDRIVNILDISLVAHSYGRKLGDERWDGICDLNKDAEINILDISIVAKDYGKTA